nr:CerR family C-terminal domain-containing protein [Pararobbsia silviterrae]
MFAERGFADATSKEICERAGTPMASVNYHFGSREGLYEAALIEAHTHIVGLEELAALAEESADPRARLRAVLERLAKLSANGPGSWTYLLVLREVLSPSGAITALIEKAVRPKAAFMLERVADVMGLKPDDAAVQRAVLLTVLPCIAMMIAPRKIQAAVLPAVSQDRGALADDFVRFAMAGIDALAAAHRDEKSDAEEGRPVKGRPVKGRVAKGRAVEAPLAKERSAKGGAAKVHADQAPAANTRPGKPAVEQLRKKPLK